MSKATKAFLLLCLSFLLAACSPDIGDKIIKCEIEGQRSGVPQTEAGLYTMSCMRRYGYKFTPSEGRCSGFRGSQLPGCYSSGG